MDAWQFIFNPGSLVLILPVAWAVWWFLSEILEHRERIQELKNEELQLELQMIEANKAQVKQEPSHAADQPMPIEDSSEEDASAPYQMGYKQQQSS